MTAPRLFKQEHIEAISVALGDSVKGLTGTEINHILATCGMPQTEAGLNKSKRLHNVLAADQNRSGDRKGILGFIRKAMKPERHLHDPARFEIMRANLNRALAFVGLQCGPDGVLVAAEAVATISDADRRAQELRTDLVRRGVHDDVLAFCKAELVADNYFHAVLEAMKSVAAKLRARTGLDDDGAALVDRALGGDLPILVINAFGSKSERDEQKGFVNLVKGAFGMFRNPTAHEARVLWSMERGDAEDLLSLASLIHRRLDKATMPLRV